MKKYVIYYRVSTEKQGHSGLGLDAQRAIVEQYLKSNAAIEVPPAFTEIESGRNNKRPELLKAIKRCKETGSTLLIAKIDRLARNVKFVFTLKEELEAAGVGFVACDLPDLNTMTLGVIASVAQHESELISQRIKGAMAAGKAKGAIYGSPENMTKAAWEKGQVNIKKNAREDIRNRHAWHFIRPLIEQGYSYNRIAKMLNDEDYTTRHGKPFFAQSVKNICILFSNH